jgi:hypothetical protein
MKKALFVLASLLVMSSFASAAIDYGDYTSVNVLIKGIWEDSVTDPGVALYGTPEYNGGDSLDFNYLNFGATASGLDGTDTVDGKLGGTIEAKPNHTVGTIKFEEYGDFTLSGFSNDAYVSVSNNIFIQVNEIDHVTVAPMTFNVPMVFTLKASWNLSEQGLASYTDIWSGVLDVDVMQGLADAGFTVTGLAATDIDFTMDNILTALSQAGTTATINKKVTDGLRVTSYDIPEPATMALLGLGGLMLRKRRA